MGDFSGGCPTSWFNQFSVVFRRSFFYKLREPAAVLTQFFNSVFLAIIIGFIYFQMGTDQASATDRVAAISFVVMCQSFLAIDLIVLFPVERAVYLRDQASGLYVTSSFYMGRSMAELPLHLLWGFLVGVITYTMMGFQEDWGRFWIYVLNMVLITNTGVAFLLFVGTISRDMAQGNLIGTLCLVLLTLFNGFFVNKKNIPVVFKWLGDISFLGYSVEVAVINEMTDLQLTCTSEERLQDACIASGDIYLERLGMQDADITSLLLLTFLESVVFRLAAYFCLHFMYTGKSFAARLKVLR